MFSVCPLQAVESFSIIFSIKLSRHQVVGIIVCLQAALDDSLNMQVVAVLFALVAVANAGLLAPATTLVRTPSFDSAIIKSDRLGGNFAYSTVEGHAYAAISPVVQNVVRPVGVSYTATPVATPIAAPIATSYAAPLAASYASPLAYGYGHGIYGYGAPLGYAGYNTIIAK